MPVRTMPGESALTRMPSRANSCASTCTSMIRAALLGPYAPRFACGLLPDIDATATIAPRAAVRAGWAALARSHVARVFTAKTRSQSSTARSEEHTSELQSRGHLVCRLLLEKKKNGDRILVVVADPLR